MPDEAAYGDILTNDAATWLASPVTQQDKVDNPITIPAPTAADATERATAKVANTIFNALELLNAWIQGDTPGGVSTGLLRLLGGVRVHDAASVVAGSGSPEGVTTAEVGSLYLRTDGAAGTSLYLKESGAGDTGWVAVGTLGGGRLTTTPSPGFGGTPPNFTYSLALDEIVTFSDSFGAGSLTVTLPAISMAGDGQLLGVYLPLGNPLSSVTITPTGTDSIADPTSSTEAQAGPGANVAISAANYSGATLLVWEAVPTAGVAQWRFRADRSGSGGGATGWPSELAVDPTTGANDPQIDDGQEVQFGAGTSKIKQPSLQAREASFASTGGNVFTNVGDALYVHDSTASVGGRVLVRAFGSARISGGTIASTTLYPFILEEEWELTSGGDTRIATFTASGSGVGQVAFGVDVSGSDRSLFLKIDDGANALRAVDVQAKIEVTAVEQEIS